VLASKVLGNAPGPHRGHLPNGNLSRKVRLRKGSHSGDPKDTARPLQVRCRHFHRSPSEAGGPAADAGTAVQADPDKV